MKHKFSLAPEITTLVKWELSSYRENKRQLERIKRDMIPSATQGYSLTAGVDGGGAKRTTEEISMKIVSSNYVYRLEHTVDAIERALSILDKNEIRLIEMIYWRKEYTPEGAGAIIGMSRATVYRRLNKIFCVVAFQLGYIKDIF